LNVYEIKVKIYLLEDISLQDSLEKIAAFIDLSFLRTKEMNEFHLQNKFKNYSFSSFFPYAENSIYKKDNLYTIIIRTVDNNLAKHFKCLSEISTDFIKGLVTNESLIYKRALEEISSLTPVIIRIPYKDGYWKNNGTIQDFVEGINKNIIRKYNEFTNNEIDSNEIIFESVTFTNRTPISTSYKGRKLLADKVKLSIAGSSIAQDISFFALGTGLLLANARGYGFCNYKFYK